MYLRYVGIYLINEHSWQNYTNFLKLMMRLLRLDLALIKPLKYFRCIGPYLYIIWFNK